MHSQEIAFAKQGALATNDWDTYQAIIRNCRLTGPLSPVRSSQDVGQHKNGAGLTGNGEAACVSRQ